MKTTDELDPVEFFLPVIGILQLADDGIVNTTEAAVRRSQQQQQQQRQRVTSTDLPFVSLNDGWTLSAIQRLVTPSVLILVTFVGNVTIVSMLTCCRRAARYRTLNRRAVNVFIVNLAVGDLTVCCFTMTTEVVFVVHGNDWVLGDVACRLIVYVQIVTLASTTFILTAMGIDRYLVVYHPLSTNKSRASKMIAVAWIMAFVVAVPQVFIFRKAAVGIYFKTSALSDGSLITTATPGDISVEAVAYVYACASKGYTAWWQRKTYFTAMSTYIFVVPTAIISFCYFNIVRAVWRHHGPLPPPPQPQPACGGATVVASGVPSPRQHGVTSATALVEPHRAGGDGGRDAPDLVVQVGQGTRLEAATERCAVNRHLIHVGRICARPVGQHVDAFGVGGAAATPNTMMSQHQQIGTLSARAKMQTLKMTLSIVGLFIICWTPYFVVHLVHIWSEYQRFIPQSVFAFADTAALLNSAVNPVLYAVFNFRSTPPTSSSRGRNQLRQRPQPEDAAGPAVVARKARQAGAAKPQPNGDEQQRRPVSGRGANLVGNPRNQQELPREDAKPKQHQPRLLQAGARIRAARSAAARRRQF